MMSRSEFAAWLCCLDDREAFELWRAAFLRRDIDQQIDQLNDFALMNHYYADPQIRRYWNSAVGRVNIAIYKFWARLRNPASPLSLAKLSLRWRYRHV